MKLNRSRKMDNTESKLREVYNSLARVYNFTDKISNLKITISKRLRSSNGRVKIQTNHFLGYSTAEIIMSKALLDEFGWETFEQTFRHEVAHIANKVLSNGRNHDESFKRWCRVFGGKMNPQMAGNSYRDCASTEYVKTIKKWSYSCPCGVVAKRAKRMSWKKRTYRTHACRSCGGSVVDWVERKIA